MPIKFQPLVLWISTIPLNVQKGILSDKQISAYEQYGQLLIKKLNLKGLFEINSGIQNMHLMDLNIWVVEWNSYKIPIEIWAIAK